MPNDLYKKKPLKRANGAGLELSHDVAFLPNVYNVTQTIYSYTLDSPDVMIPIRVEDRKLAGSPLYNVSAKYNFLLDDNNKIFVQANFQHHSRGEENGFFPNSQSNQNGRTRPEGVTNYSFGVGGASFDNKDGVGISGAIGGGVKVIKNSEELVRGGNLDISKFFIPTIFVDMRVDKEISDKFSFYGEANISYNFNSYQSGLEFQRRYVFEASTIDVQAKLGAKFDVTDNIELNAAIVSLAGNSAKLSAEESDSKLERNTRYSGIPIGTNIGFKVRF